MPHKGQSLTARVLNERLQAKEPMGRHLMKAWALPLADRPVEATAAYAGYEVYRDLQNGQLFIYASNVESARRPVYGVTFRAYLPSLAGLHSYGYGSNGAPILVEWNTRLSRWDLLLGPLANHGASFGQFDCRLDYFRYNPFWGETYDNRQCSGWVSPCYESKLWLFDRFDTGLPVTKSSTYPSIDTAMPGGWLPPAYPSPVAIMNGGICTHDGEVGGQNQWSTKWDEEFGGQWIVREDDTWGISFNWNGFVFSMPRTNMESIMFAPLRLNPRLTTAPLVDRVPSWIQACRGEMAWPAPNLTPLETSVSFSYDGGPLEPAEIVGYAPEVGWYGTIIRADPTPFFLSYRFQVFLPTSVTDPVMIICWKIHRPPGEDGERITGSLTVPQSLFWEWIYVGVTDLELFEWEGIKIYGSSS